MKVEAVESLRVPEGQRHCCAGWRHGLVSMPQDGDDKPLVDVEGGSGSRAVQPVQPRAGSGPPSPAWWWGRSLPCHVPGGYVLTDRAVQPRLWDPSLLVSGAPAAYPRRGNQALAAG